MPEKNAFMWVAAILAACHLAGVSRTVGAAEPKPSPGAPNILYILTDDQGWSQMSVEMQPGLSDSRSAYLHTPNMGRLAKDGMRFSSGYSPAPLCTPTRRSVLCGTSAARSGTEFKSAFVPAEHMTIPKALKLANPAYRCAHFGKWGEQMISTPEACGYDASDGQTGNLTGGMPRSLNPDNPKANHGNTPAFYLNNEDPKLTKSVTDRAIAFMEEQVKAGRPFYVQTSFYAVHLSVVCRQETLTKYQAKGIPDRGYTQAWAAMLEDLDEGVGRLLAALEDLDTADNTYVFFMSDNGGRGTLPGGSARRLPPNHPLSGAKHSLFEGGIRVPFLVRGPGVQPDSHCQVPVVGYDLLPTFYDLAGGEAPLPDIIDGGSMRALLTDPGNGHVTRPLDGMVFHRPRRRESAIRQGDYKLLIHWDRSGQIKARSLHNVRLDPGETKDLSNLDLAKADELKETLIGYLAGL